MPKAHFDISWLTLYPIETRFTILQTEQIRTRQLLKEQELSDQGLLCLQMEILSDMILH